MVDRADVADRLRRLLPAAWLGLLLGVALLAAPAAFATLERAGAGRVNAALFAREAWASIALALAVGALERAASRRDAAAGRGTAVGAGLLLAGVALFCTLLAQHAVAPAMHAARAGAAGWGFGALHGAGLALYAVKTLAVAALAWRASSPSGPAAAPSPS